MKNNRITLKNLHQELENLKLKTPIKSSKASKTSENLTKGGIGHDIKNSYIKNLYTRSSGLMMYLVTGIIAYGSKIPVLRNLISIVGLYYGKTTIWKFLSSLRKIFIVINAIIGVFIVFKTAGFSTENLLVGWLAVGETYLQTLGSLAGRLFKWFVELFDHKIVPNVPGDNGGTWFSKPLPSKPQSIFTSSNLNIPNLIENDTFSLRRLYKDSIPSTTSWYKDTTTWMWIIGTTCFIYFGYKFVTDPLWIQDIFSNFKKKPVINTQAPTPPNLPGMPPVSNTDVPNISLAETFMDFPGRISRGVSSIYKSTINVLNPFNYFVSATELENQFNEFLDIQYDYLRADRRFYPFTEVNPFNPWYKRLRIHYFTETMQEWTERMQFKMHAERVYESIRISKGKATDIVGATPIFSAVTSPAITPITAVGLHPSTSSLVDAINTATVSNTLSKLPQVPDVNPDWSSHVVDKTDEAFNKFKSLIILNKNISLQKGKTFAEAVSNSNVSTDRNIFNKSSHLMDTNELVSEAIESIPVTFNPFSLLSE